jgi:rare lipoprotein A
MRGLIQLLARVGNRYVTPLLAAGAVLAVPGLAWATSGGGGSGGAGTGPGGSASGQSQPNPSVPVSAGNVPVSASANGITITSQASAFMRGGVTVTGSVPGSDAGDTVEIDQLSSSSSWVPVADATAQPGGSFSATWHPSRPAELTIRAIVNGGQASSATAAPSVSLTIYRRSTATLYGPGFYGHRTACGKILRRRTIGVANRTLPCGTPVEIYYKGRVITVPVIDRGPYAHGANWDLTMATGRAIGMLETEVIGAAPVPAATSTSASAAPSGQ